MTSPVLQLNGVRSKLLQAAGSGADATCVAGWLVGRRDDTDTVVTSILQRSSSGTALKHDVDGASSLLPAGLCIVGAYICPRQDSDVQSEAESLCKECWTTCQKLDQGQSSTASCAWAVVKADDVSWFQSSNASAVSPLQISNITPSDTQHTVKQDAVTHADRQWLQHNHTCLYTELSLELHLYGVDCKADAGSKGATSANVPLTSAIDSAVQVAMDSICGPSAAFLATTDKAGTVLLRDSQSRAEFVDSLGCPPGQAVNITALCSTSGSDASAHAPHVQYQPVKGGHCSLTRTLCNLSVACYVPNSMPLSQLPDRVIKPAIRRQAEAMQRKMAQHGQVQPWSAFQVQPPGWPHLITLMYPLPKPSKDPKTGSESSDGLQEQEHVLEPVRQKLHQLLGLPANRPLLKFANAVDPRQPQSGSQQTPTSGKAVRLQNVHEGITAPAVEGGAIHMIDGTYDYHHYMQDRYDDAGWGCAYRSLQTIYSWFRHQHYTQLPVLSLQEIQQTLVDIGDKPQVFVGSRDWIGAIELGYVLDTKLDLTCKVVTVSSGADMGSKARELAHHFDTQGTPVMIGGGVLAYTLLGISYNEQTGECAFLILDPHYTGEDEISKVQAGQWISWKAPNGKAAAGGPLFVQTAFYNLLCPQRPNTV